MVLWFPRKTVPRKTVTAVVCNYNQVSTVEGSLRAYVSQSRRPDHLIVCDDASIDGSRELIERLSAQNTWIEPIFNEVNRGHIANFTDAFERCRTDYIYWGASDDLVYHDLFSEAMALFERYPQAGLFCSNYAFYHLRNGAVSQHEMPFGRRRKHFEGTRLRTMLSEAKIDFAFPSHTVIVNVAELRNAGGVIAALGARVDWFYQLVIAARTGVVFSPRVLARYTLGDTSSFSDGQFGNLQRDLASIRTMLDLLLCDRYADVVDVFFQPAVLNGAPNLLKRLALLIRDEALYAGFRRFPAIRNAIESLSD